MDPKDRPSSMTGARGRPTDRHQGKRRSRTIAARRLGRVDFSDGIAIDEDLRVNAEALPVTMERQKLFKVGDFRFGDYAIVSSKMGVSHEDDTTLFTNVLTHSDAAERFSFYGMRAVLTVFMAQYDASKPGLVYANAGHSPVIYCPRKGSARLMKADGVPIGILPITQSKDHCLNWEPGDLFVIGTDGLTEARNARNESFGYHRLVALVEELKDGELMKIPQYKL